MTSLAMRRMTPQWSLSAITSTLSWMAAATTSSAVRNLPR